MRTLVISDLHLGARLRRDVLRQPAALAALLSALADVDRLVLLGDTVELTEQRPRRSIPAAEPVLRAIGAVLGPGSEIVLVPGNHDRALIAPWIRARGADLAVSSRVPIDATPLLAQVVAALGPASVRVMYPGVWLTDRVWATHGHYLDRHLLPETAYGVLGRRPRDRARPWAYERGPSRTRLEAPLARWLPEPLARFGASLLSQARAATMPKFTHRFFSPRLAPITSKLLDVQARRAAVPALAQVAHRFGVDADWVLFGHVHRRGPLEGEDWAGAGGRPRIANSGCWTYEHRLLHRADPPHPYWPGGALVLVDDEDPVSVGLLDHLRFR